MCELLGVSESGYWAWARRPPSDRELTDAWLTERIRAIHASSSGRYGSPRVHAVLRRQGIRVGEKRVARLMALAGLQGAHQRRRRKGCTVRVEGVEPFRDLVGRDFRPAAPNRVWCADIKQIKPGEAGCTWPRCRTSSAAGSSAGRWPSTCAPSWSWRRLKWPSGRAGPPRARSTTPTTAASPDSTGPRNSVCGVNLPITGDVPISGDGSVGGTWTQRPCGGRGYRRGGSPGGRAGAA